MTDARRIFDILVSEERSVGTSIVRQACRDYLRPRKNRKLKIQCGDAKATKRLKPKQGWKNRAYERQGGNCARCGNPMTYEEAAVDHTESIISGGKHEEENTNLMHPSCNSEKSDNSIYVESKKLGRPITEIIRR